MVKGELENSKQMFLSKFCYHGKQYFLGKLPAVLVSLKIFGKVDCSSSNVILSIKLRTDLPTDTHTHTHTYSIKNRRMKHV